MDLFREGFEAGFRRGNAVGQQGLARRIRDALPPETAADWALAPEGRVCEAELTNELLYRETRRAETEVTQPLSRGFTVTG